MKFPLLFSALLALALLPVGCDNKDSAAGNSGLDITKAESAFASAEAGVKAEYEKLATAVKSADWSGAWAKIQSLASNAKLSEEQKVCLRNLGEDVRARAGVMAERTREKAGQFAEDAKKATGQAVEEAGKLAEKAKEATGKAAQDAKKAIGEMLPKK